MATRSVVALKGGVSASRTLCAQSRAATNSRSRLDFAPLTTSETSSMAIPALEGASNLRHARSTGVIEKARREDIAIVTTADSGYTGTPSERPNRAGESDLASGGWTQTDTFTSTCPTTQMPMAQGAAVSPNMSLSWGKSLGGRLSGGERSTTRMGFGGTIVRRISSYGLRPILPASAFATLSRLHSRSSNSTGTTRHATSLAATRKTSRPALQDRHVGVSAAARLTGVLNA